MTFEEGFGLPIRGFFVHPAGKDLLQNVPRRTLGTASPLQQIPPMVLLHIPS